jgi:hypothetical protein
MQAELPARALAERLLQALVLLQRLELQVLARRPHDGDDEQDRLQPLRPVPALLQAAVARPRRDVGG